MCGVSGVSFVSEAKKGTLKGIPLFKKVLKENTRRGKHGTGIVYGSPTYPEVFRGFATGDVVKEFITPSVVDSAIIGHTRQATIGDKEDRNNLHPFITNNIIGVHNGTIFNYRELKERFGLKTVSDCDSEVIFQLIDKHGPSSLKHVYGTYLIAYIYKKAPNKIHIITNGSKPLILMQGKDFVVFGSIIPQELFIETKEYELFNLLPATHYVVESGKAIYVKKVPGITIMTEKEGELRYKLEFKNLRRDEFLGAIPISRRLTHTKEKTTHVYTKNVNTYSGTTINKVEEAISSKVDCEQVSGMIKLIRNSIDNLFYDKERILMYSEIPLEKLFFKGHYGSTHEQNGKHFNNVTLESIQVGGNNYLYRNMYALETLMFACMFSNYTKITKPKNNYIWENIFNKETTASLLSTLFLSKENKFMPNFIDYVKEQLVDTGILHGELVHEDDLVGYYKKVPYNSKCYDYTIYTAKRQSGNHFKTLNEYKEFCRSNYLLSGNPNIFRVQRILLFSIILAKQAIKEKTLGGIFSYDESKDIGITEEWFNISTKFSYLTNKQYFNYMLERLESHDASAMCYSVGTQKEVLDYLSIGYPSLILAHDKEKRTIPNGNDLISTLFERKEEDGDREMSHYLLACRLVYVTRRLNEIFLNKDKARLSPTLPVFDWSFF